MPELLLSEIKKYLSGLGVSTCDCDFETLRQCVIEATRSEKDPFSCAPPKFWQEDKIMESILPHSSVLDIGCGEGILLSQLAEKCRSQVQGIELSQENVLKCIERGIPTLHGDAEKIISQFPSNSFDYAVLQNTLQTLKTPIDLLHEMLRISSRAFVSFPNFAHWQIRLAFSLGGRMPVNANLPNTWYNTQNIHLCSINDFIDWADSANVTVSKAWVAANGQILEYRREHNLIAEHALFMIETPGK